MKPGNKSKTTIILQCILLVICVMMGVVGYVIWEHTLCSWWYPAGIALILALVSAPIWVRNKRSLLWHLVVGGSLCYMLFLGMNTWCADPAKSITESAIVTEKYSKKHNDYRRVGRNRYIPNGSHNTYHIAVQLESGETRNFEVTLSEYNKIRKGSQRTVTRNDGFFGMPVIRL